MILYSPTGVKVDVDSSQIEGLLANGYSKEAPKEKVDSKPVSRVESTVATQKR